MSVPSLRRPIALVGMPGAGKTSVGRLLAVRLGCPFLDTDEAVVAEAGRSVEELFYSEGQPAFRERERHIIARTFPPLVISTGGGAMTEPQTREILLARTLTIWLQASAETLERRLAGATPRPLLSGAGRFEKLQTMLAERHPFYALAHLHVPAEDGDAATIAERILAALPAS